MDKRWIYILIIFIVGLVACYFIVESSDYVGKATTVFGKFQITLPDDFTIGENKGGHSIMGNKKTKERIDIEDLGKNTTRDNEFKKYLSEIKSNGNIEIEKENVSGTYNGIALQTVFYKSYNNDSYVNASTTFFEQYNHTFSLKFINFTDGGEKEFSYIMDTLTPDLKQKQD